jgi:hypothetical protein
MPHHIGRPGVGIVSKAANFIDGSQPPYSPDISLCDFFRFDDLKTKRKGEEFET